MEWRIRKHARGGFSVERGLNHKGGEKIPGVMGTTMTAFIVYESAHFDTDEQVKSFMKRKRAELMQGGESWAVTDNLGVVHCEHCGAELICDDCGDMPESCPKCRRTINWSTFDA